MTDWQGLLSDLRIPWRDRGRNTSRGNINVCCPFCGDDDGFHLAISEDSGAFYCYRNPNRHSGTSARRLLVALGMAYNDIPRILASYASGKRQPMAVRDAATVVSPLALRWPTFPFAYDEPRVARYLCERGFADPIVASRMFDLRCNLVGVWSCRLLLPIKRKGNVLTWTGRSVLPHIEPKYLVEAKSTQNIPDIYVPSEVYVARAKRVVLVEGPIDALKVAWGAQNPDVSSVALCGKNMSSERLLRLRELLGSAERIDVALDNDAGWTESADTINKLKGLMLPGQLRRLRIPREHKDAGEMSSDEVWKWINQSR